MTPQGKIDAAKRVIDQVEQENERFNDQIDILILALNALLPGTVIKIPSAI